MLATLVAVTGAASLEQVRAQELDDLPDGSSRIARGIEDVECMPPVGLIHQRDVKILAKRERDESIDGRVQCGHLVASGSHNQQRRACEGAGAHLHCWRGEAPLPCTASDVLRSVAIDHVAVAQRRASDRPFLAKEGEGVGHVSGARPDPDSSRVHTQLSGVLVDMTKQQIDIPNGLLVLICDRTMPLDAMSRAQSMYAAMSLRLQPSTCRPLASEYPVTSTTTGNAALASSGGR